MNLCSLVSYYFDGDTMISLQTESTKQTDSECGKEFERFMFIAHLYAMRCAFRDVSSLGTLVIKLLVALLRYTDVVPADKAYYEAGIAAQVRVQNFYFTLLSKKKKPPSTEYNGITWNVGSSLAEMSRKSF